MTAAPCPVCSSTDTTEEFVSTDLLLKAAQGQFAYRRCQACQSVFQSPQIDDATLASAYPSYYGNYAAQHSLVERIAEPLARREAHKLKKVVDPGLPLIEMGCGSGRFLERVRAVGWTGELSGNEFDPDTARSTAERLGIEVIPGQLETVDLPEAHYGTIVLRHVIEHVRDPVGLLPKLFAALRPGGYLYLATPDNRALAAKTFGKAWVGYDVPRHLVVFSSPALRTALQSSDFEIAAEWWGWSPDMWAGSLDLKLPPREKQRRWTHPANPLTLPFTGAAAAVEVARKRSTMYGVVARRPV